MTGVISAGVAKWLAHEGVIAEKEQHLFSYAVYSLFLGLLPIIISIALGAILGVLYESFLLLLPFMLLRKFSGGFHFNSARICIICSTALIALALGIVKLLLSGIAFIPFLICVSLSVISLWVNSPIESLARKLSAKETELFRKISRTLTVIIFLMFLLLLFFQNKTAIPIGVGIIVPALLQIPCVVGAMYSTIILQHK